MAYDSPALDPYRNRLSGLHRGEARDRWEVRYDPYRLNEVFIRDHHQQEWIRAEWTLAQQTAGPFSIDVLHAARQALRHRPDVQPRSAVALLGEVNRIQTELNDLSAKERSAARRQGATPPTLAALPSNVDPVGAVGPAAGRTTMPPAVVPLRRGRDGEPGGGEGDGPRRRIERILYDDPSEPVP